MARAEPKDKKALLKKRERNFVFQAPGPQAVWVNGEQVAQASISQALPTGERQPQRQGPIPARRPIGHQRVFNDKEKKRNLAARLQNNFRFQPVCTSNDCIIHVRSSQGCF